MFVIKNEKGFWNGNTFASVDLAINYDDMMIAESVAKYIGADIIDQASLYTPTITQVINSTGSDERKTTDDDIVTMVASMGDGVQSITKKAFTHYFVVRGEKVTLAKMVSIEGVMPDVIVNEDICREYDLI